MEGSVKKRKVDPPKVGRAKARKTGRVKTRKATVEESDYVANLLRVPDVFEMSTPDYAGKRADWRTVLGRSSERSDWCVVHLRFDEAYDNPWENLPTRDYDCPVTPRP